MSFCYRATPSKEPGRPAWILGSAALCLLALSTPCLGAVICPGTDASGMRVDFQTILISPSARRGYVQTDIFLGFRVSETIEPETPFSILIPVEGVPFSVKAQAMTLSEFDQRYTHSKTMEGAFYARARAEKVGRTCLYTGIAATAGPPAWFMLAPHWPPRAPPITAVIPEPTGEDPPYHNVLSARIATRDDALRDKADMPVSGPLRVLWSAKSDYLISIDFTPFRKAEREMEAYATAGIRISYEAPLQSSEDGWRMRLPLLDAPSSNPIALTRLYVNMPASRNVELDVPRSRNGFASPQGIVNSALSAFGYSAAFRTSAAQQRANTSLTSVRTSHAGKTSRLVASFAHSDTSLTLRLRRSAAGPVHAAMTALGAVLLGLLWPFTLVLYVMAIWGSTRAYFWMISLRHPENSLRSMAMLAGLFPIITPWIALRFIVPKGPLPHDGDRSGALGVLSMRHYDAVARLILWGALICVNWAILESILRLALYLRFQ